MKLRTSLEIKITDRCNQLCFFCMNRDNPVALRNIDGAAVSNRLREWHKGREESPFEITEARMTGGEPLMELATVMEIASTCRQVGIASGVNTNATLLDQATAQRLSSSGLTVFKASLDAANEKSYRAMRGHQTSLSEALAGIRNAALTGFEVVIRFTLCELNRSQILPCYELADEIGAAAFQVKPLIPSSRGAGSGYLLSREAVATELRKLADASRGRSVEVIALCCAPEDAYGLRSKPCGSLNKVYLSASGDAFLCNYMSMDKPRGNLRTNSLDWILKNLDVRLMKTANGHNVPYGCPQWQC